MAKNDRFEKIYSQGTMNVTEIWVDKETGVNYMYHVSGYSGGLTPLLKHDRFSSKQVFNIDVFDLVCS